MKRACSHDGDRFCHAFVDLNKHAIFEIVEEIRNGLDRAFGFEFDATVGAIANPPGNAVFFGRTRRPIAKSNALNVSVKPIISSDDF